MVIINILTSLTHQRVTPVISISSLVNLLGLTSTIATSLPVRTRTGFGWEVWVRVPRTYTHRPFTPQCAHGLDIVLGVFPTECHQYVSIIIAGCANLDRHVVTTVTSYRI